MNLIDLYIQEVGDHLPAKTRADIQAEIRSLIEDTLEGRSQAAGREPDEAMIVEVLKEFGSPQQMAASYMPPRYLIGPRLFPTFLLVVRIVAVVLGVLAIIGFVIEAGAPGLSPQSIARIAGESIVDFIVGLLSALGNIVFVFAILEWALPKGADKKEGWDPRSMKPRQDPERTNPVELFWGIGLSILAIFLFNLYPHLLGIWIMQDGVWTVVPVLTDAFFRYIPLMTAVWGLQIVLNIVLLRQGGWQPATRWLQIAIKVFGLVILALLIAGPAIVQIPVAAGSPLQSLRGLEQLVQTALRIALLIALVVDSIETVKMLVRLVTRSSRPLVMG